jgi:hypothetical protein
MSLPLASSAPLSTDLLSSPGVQRSLALIFGRTHVCSRLAGRRRGIRSGPGAAQRRGQYVQCLAMAAAARLCGARRGHGTGGVPDPSETLGKRRGLSTGKLLFPDRGRRGRGAFGLSARGGRSAGPHAEQRFGAHGDGGPCLERSAGAAGPSAASWSNRFAPPLRINAWCWTPFTPAVGPSWCDRQAPSMGPRPLGRGEREGCYHLMVRRFKFQWGHGH